MKEIPVLNFFDYYFECEVWILLHIRFGSNLEGNLVDYLNCFYGSSVTYERLPKMNGHFKGRYNAIINIKSQWLNRYMAYEDLLRMLIAEEINKFMIFFFFF